MSKFFVFFDLDYYPYVGEPIEAESAEEALRIALEGESPGSGMTAYVCPADAVVAGAVQGPKPKPEGILALQEKSNAARSERMRYGNDMRVVVQGGSFIP